MDDNFFSIGGDSITAIHLVSELRKASLNVKILDIFQHQSIRELAKFIERQQDTSDFLPITDTSFEEYNLTPIQIWFFEHCNNFNCFNHNLLLKADSSIDIKKIKKAIETVFNVHKVLSSVFYKKSDSWKTKVETNVQKNIFSEEYLWSDSDNALIKVIQKKSEKYNLSLDIEKGEITKVVIFYANYCIYIQIIIHHLVVDGISWRTILEDLNALYSMPIEEISEESLYKPAEFKQWSDYLHEHVNESRRHEVFWENVLKKVKAFPVEFSKNSHKKLKTLDGFLEGNLVEDLQKNIPNYTIYKTHEILISSICAGLLKWSEENVFSILIESHGRNVDVPFDISKTIGWFTCFYPMHFSISNRYDVHNLLNSVQKEIKLLPLNLHSYCDLKYLSDFNKLFDCYKEPDIRFNFLGSFNDNDTTQVIRFEDMQFFTDEEYDNKLKLDINVMIVKKRLSYSFTYNQNFYSEETIKKFIANCINKLNELIEALKKTNNKFLEAALFSQKSIEKDEILRKLNNEFKD